MNIIIKTVTESVKEIIDENAEELDRHEYIIIEIIVIGGKADYLTFKPSKKKKKK